jgi:hypothetical protein
MNIIEMKDNRMTPRDLLHLGYSPEWVALSIRIATHMQMKARQQARIK